MFVSIELIETVTESEKEKEGGKKTTKSIFCAYEHEGPVIYVGLSVIPSKL